MLSANKDNLYPALIMSIAERTYIGHILVNKQKERINLVTLVIISSPPVTVLIYQLAAHCGTQNRGYTC